MTFTPPEGYVAPEQEQQYQPQHQHQHRQRSQPQGQWCCSSSSSQTPQQQQKCCGGGGIKKFLFFAFMYYFFPTLAVPLTIFKIIKLAKQDHPCKRVAIPALTVAGFIFLPGFRCLIGGSFCLATRLVFLASMIVGAAVLAYHSAKFVSGGAPCNTSSTNNNNGCRWNGGGAGATCRQRCAFKFFQKFASMIDSEYQPINPTNANSDSAETTENPTPAPTPAPNPTPTPNPTPHASMYPDLSTVTPTPSAPPPTFAQTNSTNNFTNHPDIALTTMRHRKPTEPTQPPSQA